MMRQKTMDAMAASIAKELNRPEKIGQTENGNGFVYNKGALRIERGSKTYGRAWKLVEITNEHGGENDLLRSKTSAGLCNLMIAMLRGIRMGRE